jgi:site-specific DNA-adenine methylase
MAEYGIPYMGSKDKICEEIIRIFPKADNFYDLFGGGFSVTHAMLLRRRNHFKYFHFNEISPGICDLIKNAIAGKYNYDVFKPPFVSRNEFFANLDTDPMIKIIWSFGNNGRGYIFSKEIEPYKRSMHNSIVFNDFDELAEKTLGLKKFNDGYTIFQKRLFLRHKIEFYRKTKVPEFLWPFLNESDLKIVKANKTADNFKCLQQLQRLQQLEQLERLELLERLERINFYTASYENVPIKENSVIYCDIPYKGTADYDGEFNHKAFFDWADAQKNPVFISEYNIDDERFKLVFKTQKRSLFSSKNKYLVKTEKVYGNKAAVNALGF